MVGGSGVVTLRKRQVHFHIVQGVNQYIHFIKNVLTLILAFMFPYLPLLHFDQVHFLLIVVAPEIILNSIAQVRIPFDPFADQIILP